MICTQCRQDLPVESFSWKQKNVGRRSTTCKECKKLQQNAWYQSHKVQHMLNVRENKKDIQLWFKEYKTSLTCARCPENHPACLDFHHRDPSEKDNSVSLMAQRGVAKATILKEIAKCDVLCANCHRKLHAPVVQR